MENSKKLKIPLILGVLLIIAIIVIMLLLWKINIDKGIDKSTNKNGNSHSYDNDLDSKIERKSLKSSDLSIKDFDWKVTKRKVYGENAYELTLTNNSQYPILGVQLDYKTKDTVTEEELKVYSNFMEEHESYIEDSPISGVILRGYSEKFIKTGETINEIYFTVGYDNWSWYDYPTEEQFNLMEPKELQLAIIGKDDIIYIAYYDFENKEWVLDSETVPINEWPDNEISKKIEKPDCEYFLLTSDFDEEDLDFYAYDVTQDEYDKYVEMAKKIGFNVNSDYDDFDFDAEDEEGNEVSIYYDEEERLLEVDFDMVD